MKCSLLSMKIGVIRFQQVNSNFYVQKISSFAQIPERRRSRTKNDVNIEHIAKLEQNDVNSNTQIASTSENNEVFNIPDPINKVDMIHNAIMHVAMISGQVISLFFFP